MSAAGIVAGALTNVLQALAVNLPPQSSLPGFLMEISCPRSRQSLSIRRDIVFWVPKSEQQPDRAGVNFHFWGNFPENFTLNAQKMAPSKPADFPILGFCPLSPWEGGALALSKKKKPQCVTSKKNSSQCRGVGNGQFMQLSGSYFIDTTSGENIQL